MSFTAAELRLLQIADAVEEGRRQTRRRVVAVQCEAAGVSHLDQQMSQRGFGRPRKPSTGSDADRRRAQKRAAYYRRKLTRDQHE